MTVTTDRPLLRGLNVPVIFGAAWLVAGISGLTSGSAVLIWCAPAAVAAFAVYLGCRRAIFSRPARPRVVSPSASRTFGLVNLAQGTVILVSVFVLARAGVPGLIVAAVCLVVGLHFVPLGRIFGVPAYYVTGALLVGFAVAGAIVYWSGGGTGATRAVVGLGAAATLWGSALVISHRS